MDLETRARLFREYGGEKDTGAVSTGPAASIGVVISSRNEGRRIRATVDCFRGAAGVALETIVVDDASTDRSCAGLPGHVIRRESQCGVGPNLNSGAGLALALGAEALIFSDAHVRASAALLRAVAAKCVAEPCIVSPAARAYAGLPVAFFGGRLARRDIISIQSAEAPPISDWGRVGAPLGGFYAMSAATAKILSGPTGEIFDTVAAPYGYVEEMLAIKAHFLAVPVWCCRGDMHEHLFLTAGKGGGLGREKNLVYVLALYFSPEFFDERFLAAAVAMLGPDEVAALRQEAQGKCNRTWTIHEERAFYDSLPEA